MMRPLALWARWFLGGLQAQRTSSNSPPTRADAFSKSVYGGEESKESKEDKGR